MISTVQLKKHMFDACILGIIISKLNYCYKPSLFILLKVDKTSKISFYSAVLPLSLTISLRIESSGEVTLNAKNIIEERSELQGKN